MIQTIRYGDGEQLAFTDCGERAGYPILVQHGLIASIEDGDLFARLVEAGLRPICVARPGYGQSSPHVMRSMAGWGAIVAALVDALGLAHCDVLGMSSGAPYSYAIGHRLPGRVRRIFIFSGTPALYDERIVARWPYPVNRQASLPELQNLARDLFFSALSPADLGRNDIRDSMRHDCFGIAQDFKLRCNAWGFRLADVSQPVTMRHSREDDQVPFVTAEMTARLLPHCQLDARDHGPHFSRESLDEFLGTVIASPR